MNKYFLKKEIPKDLIKYIMKGNNNFRRENWFKRHYVQTELEYRYLCLYVPDALLHQKMVQIL